MIDWTTVHAWWLAPDRPRPRLPRAANGGARPRRVLLFMGLLHMLCHGLLTVYLPLLVVIQADFGLTRVEPVAALLTWSTAAFALVSLPAGLLGDRLPSKWVAGLGLALQGLGLLAAAQAPTLGWLRFWLVVAAAGAAGFHPIAARVVPGLYPHRVGWATGLVGIGAGLGFWLGPWYGGWRAEAAGWRAPLAEVGAVAVVVAVLYALLTREPQLRELPLAPGQARLDRRHKVLLIGAVAAVGLLVVPRDFGAIGLDTLHPFYLDRGFGLSVGVIGAILSAKGLISLLVNPLVAWASDRGGRLIWWCGTIVGSAICAALVPVVPTAWVPVALVLQGTLLLANFPVFEAALVERLPARLRGRAYALILCIVALAAAAAPKVVGAKVDLLLDHRSIAVAPEAFAGLYWQLAIILLLSLAVAPMFAWLGKQTWRSEQLDARQDAQPRM